ncbi:MAG: cytochrome P450 [Pseudomonadota bacterium]
MSLAATDPALPHAEIYRSRLIEPPAERLPLFEGLKTMSRNPAEWWPRIVYEDGLMVERLMGHSYAHVARPELVRKVLLDEAHAYNRSFITQRLLKPAMDEGVLTTDGEAWRFQRRVLAPLFRQQELNRYVPAMDRSACAAAHRLAKSGPGIVDVMPEMVRTTLDIIIETLFGEADVDKASLARDIDLYVRFLGRVDMLDLFRLPGWVPRPWKGQGFAAVKRLRAACQTVLETVRHGEVEAGGLIGRLKTAVDPDTGEGLSDKRIVDNILTFVGAGHETTSLALTWSLYLLADQPALQAQLAEEARTFLGATEVDATAVEGLDLATRVVEEAMRLYPPVSATGRNVTAKTSLGPVELNPGDHVTLAIMPMHRNPALWPDPDRFDTERFSEDAKKTRDRFAYLPLTHPVLLLKNRLVNLAS